MRYYMITENGYIEEIGTGDKGEQITEDKYIAIREAPRNCPADTETHTYRLDTSVEWVAVPKEDNPTAEELLNILTGGEA